MNLRAPMVPEDAVPNRFGWRHEGPGPQWPKRADPKEELLPSERFDHPALKRRPCYVPEREGIETFSFMLRKGCAGLAHRHRREPEPLYRRITRQTMRAKDVAAVRWMISALHTDEDFVRLHTMGRLSIEELAYVVRTAYGPARAPFRAWLNQWAREPEKPLPSLPGTVMLRSEDELMGLRIDDIPAGDDRRIDEEGVTYLKLNGPYLLAAAKSAPQVSSHQ